MDIGMTKSKDSEQAAERAEQQQKSTRAPLGPDGTPTTVDDDGSRTEDGSIPPGHVGE